MIAYDYLFLAASWLRDYRGSLFAIQGFDPMVLNEPTDRSFSLRRHGYGGYPLCRIRGPDSC